MTVYILDCIEKAQEYERLIDIVENSKKREFL